MPGPFKLKSGNTTPFKMMGSSPVKQTVINPKKSRRMNLAFDVTPAKFVTVLITEKGVCEASADGLKKLFK